MAKLFQSIILYKKEIASRSDYIVRNRTFSTFNHSDSWVILSAIEQRIKEKIERVGIPLKDWDIQINYGIKTGFNEAFIISGEKRKELIEKDPKSEEIIRPILRGRDIKRYNYEFADLYLLFIPWHFPLHNDTSIVGASEKAEQEFENQYPAIYNHLLKYKNQLSNRNKAETGIRYEWYALQRWGANYWEDFYRPKIMYSEIVKEPQFYLDRIGEFFPEATTFIITGQNLEYLCNLFNSKIIAFIFKTFYAGGGLGENGYRYKKIFFEKLPIPVPDQIIEDKIKKNILLKKDYEIDNIIYKLYDLSNEEIEYIVSQ